MRVWLGRIPQPPEAIAGLGTKHPAARVWGLGANSAGQFLQFFRSKNAFYA